MMKKVFISYAYNRTNNAFGIGNCIIDVLNESTLDTLGFVAAAGEHLEATGLKNVIILNWKELRG